jgi:DNA polymerase elongation subunit (family B)
MYKFVEHRTKQRLVDWHAFRLQLETSETPLDDVVNYFQSLPRVKVYTDPYDQSTWPTAWQLIDENEYCQFNITLAICYTLQLTTHFENSSPLIKIAIDRINKVVYYLLFIDNKIYGYDDNNWIPVDSLPKTLKYLKIYNMPPLH